MTAARTPPPAALPELRIRLKRASDGSAALSCVRADGSSTWQRQRGATAAYLPAHDLTHWAVETVLGYRRAFYGLIVEGWEIADFGAPWPRGPLPAEARAAELVVGVFDLERTMGGAWSAAELREQAARYAASGHARHGAVALPTLDDATVETVRARRADALARWAAVPPGGTLELPFTRPP